ncbi:glycosyltransferase [Desulfoscipio geothermicus]|uniref:Glycosyltransferase involved in cell wall bisynthesis n=1 Tax=Desulfoscipio geothermicus DSM 3669 TaxID=1121426 RepID=A0A1I6DTI4_9FIRM|nr:glycosyltransferase family 2 protein [Desulfoscipio geothermicus]SFR08726.1 Glycosyltransferase involved in cell wall bisynthesis [Desulfoscipio geothermicus DSM 3669]
MFKKIHESNFPGITYQPYIYLFAAFLGHRYECKYIINIGGGNGASLAGFHPNFQFIGIGSGFDFHLNKMLFPFVKWLEHDLENPGSISLPQELLSNSVIICTDVIQHLNNPHHLLATIKKWMDYAPVCLLSAPAADLARDITSRGSLAHSSPAPKWNLKEFEQFLLSFGFNITHTGLALDGTSREKNIILSIIEKNNLQCNCPDSFKVVAIMAAYNEEDIIYHSIKRLIDQEIYVYVIENWSTDATYEIIKQFEGNDFFLGSERYPPGGRESYFHLKGLLKRTEELAKKINADWFIHHDVDEIRESPWPGVNLKEGIYRADRMGFNAIDHTVITFCPVDNGFAPGSDFERYFKYFEFSKHPGDFIRINAWKNTGKPVLLSFSGGHEIAFAGRRVFPYKFLMKHYPIRSQSHGEKKVFADRKPRWHPEERAAGWHTHYDNIAPESSFLRRREELRYFNRAAFHKEFLLDRLSGIGIFGLF